VAIATALTPEQQIADLGDAVQQLVTGGALLPSDGNSLQVKLNAILAQVENDHIRAAVKKLSDFILHVKAFIKTGKLTPGQGQPLIDAAQALIAELSA